MVTNTLQEAATVLGNIYYLLEGVFQLGEKYIRGKFVLGLRFQSFYLELDFFLSRAFWLKNGKPAKISIIKL